MTHQTKINLPEIPEQEMTPAVKALLSVISQCIDIIDPQAKEIQKLRDEIARLKGNTPIYSVYDDACGFKITKLQKKLSLFTNIN